MKYIQNYNVKTNLKANVHITHNTQSKSNFLKKEEKFSPEEF